MSHGAEEELDFMGLFPLVNIGCGLDSMVGRLGLTGSDGFCVKPFTKLNVDWPVKKFSRAVCCDKVSLKSKAWLFARMSNTSLVVLWPSLLTYGRGLLPKLLWSVFSALDWIPFTPIADAARRSRGSLRRINVMALRRTKSGRSCDSEDAGLAASESGDCDRRSGDLLWRWSEIGERSARRLRELYEEEYLSRRGESLRWRRLGLSDRSLLTPVWCCEDLSFLSNSHLESSTWSENQSKSVRPSLWRLPKHGLYCSNLQKHIPWRRGFGLPRRFLLDQSGQTRPEVDRCRCSPSTHRRRLWSRCHCDFSKTWRWRVMMMMMMMMELWVKI